MSGARKRGRPTTAPKAHDLHVLLTDADYAELKAAAGLAPLGPFLVHAALQWTRSNAGCYQAYMDSGRMAADEAQEALHELERMENDGR